MKTRSAKPPTRITVAFDPSTASLLEKISAEDQVSQSEVMRRALRFYNDNKAISDPATNRKVYSYLNLLSSGEHVILDVDHWMLFLDLIEKTPSKEEFWSKHRQVAQSHKDQLRNKVTTIEEILERLETCNFFRITKNSNKDFTLILGSELPKKFVRVVLEEFLAALNIKAEITEHLAKLHVVVKS